MAVDFQERAGRREDHVVHFFETEGALGDAVSAYLTASVLGGDGVVIIATEPHRQRFRRGLAAAGIDVEKTEGSGRLRILDASEMLALFRSGCGLDQARFDRVMGGLLDEVAATGRRVRIYGEMVALLWADGAVSDAMDLERLWNEIGERTPFSLFCAYPAGLFDRQPASSSFAEVCQLHSDVVAGAPVPGDVETVRRFPRSPHAAALARRFVRETLEAWSIPAEAFEDTLLVTSELVTNAVVHAGSDVAIGLARRPGQVRVSVSDRSGTAPRTRGETPGSLDGRGIRMVGAIASGWGVSQLDGGKAVWAEVAFDEHGGGHGAPVP